MTQKQFEKDINTDIVLKQYLITALWSSIDENDNPLDDEYMLKDITRESIEKSQIDIELFLNEAIPLFEKHNTNIDYSMLGHDFWLTRNHNGAGFWDGDYEEQLGKELTELSNKFSEVTLYVNDCNKLDIL